MRIKIGFALAAAPALMLAASYSGPRPSKHDVPFLLHGDRLTETESCDAREEGGKKNDATYVIAGASSPARTPMAEPIFLMDVQQFSAERIELYKLDARNGRREISLTQKRRRNGVRPLHLLVTRLADRLYRIEADEPLENGEYALSPSDSNRAFCFAVY
jgi:hypothetical protein